MATVAQAISDAYSRIGVIGENQTASGAQMAKGFALLNIINDSWAAERLTIPFIQRTTSNIEANQASYTVGPGGDIATSRPVYLTGISYVDTSQDPDLELPLANWTDDMYQLQPQKALTSTLPIAAYYNPTYASGLGTLIPWPIPTSTTLNWVIYHPVAVDQFASTSATLALPPGYHEFVVTALAFKLCSVYGVPGEVRSDIEKEAISAKALIKVANARMSDLAMPAGSLVNRNGRHSSYYSFLAG